jgi:hypothetical protein
VLTPLADAVATPLAQPLLLGIVEASHRGALEAALLTNLLGKFFAVVVLRLDGGIDLVHQGDLGDLLLDDCGPPHTQGGPRRSSAVAG